MSKMNKIRILELDSINANTLDPVTWTPFTAGHLREACFLLRITNRSDAQIFVSFDGANDHEYIPVNGNIEVELPPNATAINNHYPSFKNRTTVYLRGNPFKDGYVFLSGYYSFPN